MGEKGPEISKERTEGTQGLTWSREDWISQIEKTFEERDQLYRKRDEAFEARTRALEKKERVFQKKVESLEQREDAVSSREEAVSRQSAEIAEREQAIQRAIEKMEAEEETLKKRLNEKMMKLHLMQEQAKNEKTRQETAKLDYESRLMLLDDQSLRLLKDQDLDQELAQAEQKRKEAEDRYQEVLRKNRDLQRENEDLRKMAEESEAGMTVRNENQEKEIAELRDALDNLTLEKDDLIEENTRLEQEKRDLFKQLVGADDDVPEDEGEAKDSVEEEVSDPSEELALYLRNHCPDAQVLQQGDQVALKQDGIAVDFSYQSPPVFHIRKKAPDNRRVRRMIEKKNRGDGIEFAYDEERGEVVATGYFTEEMPPSRLMHSVTQIILHDFEVGEEEKWRRW